MGDAGYVRLKLIKQPDFKDAIPQKSNTGVLAGPWCPLSSLEFGFWNLSAVAGILFLSAFGGSENIPKGGKLQSKACLAGARRSLFFARTLKRVSLDGLQKWNGQRPGLALGSGRDCFSAVWQKSGPRGGPATGSNPSANFVGDGFFHLSAFASKLARS